MADLMETSLDSALRYVDATLRGKQDHWSAMRDEAEVLAHTTVEFLKSTPDTASDKVQILVDRAVRLVTRLREIREPRNPRFAEYFRASRAFYRGTAAMLLTLNHSPNNSNDTLMAMNSFSTSAIETLKYGNSQKLALELFRLLLDTLKRCNLELLDQQVGDMQRSEALTAVVCSLEQYAEVLHGGQHAEDAEYAQEVVDVVGMLGKVNSFVKGDKLRLAHVAHYHGRTICAKAADGDLKMVEAAVELLRIAMDACETTSNPASSSDVGQLQGKILFALCFCFAHQKQPERALICLTNLERICDRDDASKDATKAGEATQDEGIRLEDVQLARCFVFTTCTDLQNAMTAIQQLIRGHNNFAYSMDAIRKFSAASRYDHRSVVLLEELLQKFSFEPNRTQLKTEIASVLLARAKDGGDSSDVADEAAKIFDQILADENAVSSLSQEQLTSCRRTLWLWTSFLRSLNFEEAVNEWCTRILRFLPKASLGGTLHSSLSLKEEYSRAHLWKSAALLALSQADSALSHANQAFRQQANEASLIGVFFASAHTPQRVEDVVANVESMARECQVELPSERRALVTTLLRLASSIKVNPTRKYDVMLHLLRLWLRTFVAETEKAGSLPDGAESFGMMLRSMLKAALLKTDSGHHGEQLYLKESPDVFEEVLRQLQGCVKLLDRATVADSKSPSVPPPSDPAPNGQSRFPIEKLGSREDFEYISSVLWNISFTAAKAIEQKPLPGSLQTPAADAPSEDPLLRPLVEQGFATTSDFCKLVLLFDGVSVSSATAAASSSADEEDCIGIGGEEKAGGNAMSTMLPLAQLDLLKRQGHALAASLTLTLESDPVPAEGQVLQNAVVAQRLDELGTVTNLLLEQSGASDRDPDVSKLRDLLVALRLDACVTKEALDEFLHSSERMLFTMPAELLLSMTDRMAARHTLPTGHVYRLYRLCHQVVNRHSGAPSKSLVLRVLTSMFRFADTNETSARVLDEALQICADPRWALPRSSTPASPTSPVDDCYLEWLCARAHNRGLACIETKDTSGAEGFLSRALQLLPYTGEPFQQENHKEISALYARALEARGKAQNEGGTAVKDLFR